MNVFVDSSVFISIWDKDDSNHKIALDKASKLQGDKDILITSNIVVSEVLTVLSMKLGIEKANKFGDYIVSEKLKVIFIDKDIHDEAFDIFKRRTSKNLSFFDCTSFALIREFRIDKVFSFDKDYKKYKFDLV